MSTMVNIRTHQRPLWSYSKRMRCPSGHPSPPLCITRKSHTSCKRNSEPTRIAVIGGGITGLATTFYAAKRYPKADVTLFESSNRVGGVIESHTLDLKDRGTVLCEMGVRTLRANAPRAIVTIDLIRELGLEDDLRLIPKSDPTASNRYIYYPDHLVSIPVANISKSVAHVPAPDGFDLHRLWRLVRTLYCEPLFSGLVPGMLRGLFTRRPRHITDDDSIYNVLARRFGRRITENLGSAVIHGLYAGDLHRLSARALLPGLWALESRLSIPKQHFRWSSKHRVGNSVGIWTASESAMLQKIRLGAAGDLERRRFQEGTVFSFGAGVGQLVDRLSSTAQEMKNVTVNLNSRAASIVNTEESVLLHVDGFDKGVEPFSHVISTTSLPITLRLINRETIPSVPTLSHVPVMTVALCYATPHLNDPYRGFGYLLPSSLSHSQNPECALGVVFDSDAIPNQDTFQGSKISVMLGGHYWSTLPTLPSIDEGIEMAKSVLRRHLKIIEAPIRAVARLEREAIPQYRVGHFGMLREVHGMLSQFEGSVRVAGNSYSGIGVHDCLFSARRVVEGLDEERKTGLEWCQQL